MTFKLLSVTEAIYQPPGEHHEYRLNDGSVAIEFPKYPGATRWRFYDGAGRRIIKRTVHNAMKAAVERHKRRFNCK